MSLMGIDEVIILCIELDEALGLGQLVRLFARSLFAETDDTIITEEVRKVPSRSERDRGIQAAPRRDWPTYLI
jgi:hypothetical protein